MEITRAVRPGRQMTDVKLWHCCDCDAVHMTVKELTFNFNRDEFAAFADAVVDISYRAWNSYERKSIADLGTTRDGTIH